MRTTVTDWSNQYRQYLPTITTSGSPRYTEEAIEIFEIISRMSDANKSMKSIKDHLQELREKAAAEISEDEEPASPDIHNLNLQFKEETMELRNVVQTLTQKLEANKQPRHVKDHLQDLAQKAAISSMEYGALMQPISDSINVRLNKEVIELRKNIQALTEKINEVIQQDARNEITSKVESLNTRYDGVSEEIAELREVMQKLIENVTEIVEQDMKSELIAIAESLDKRYDGVFEEVKELRSLTQTLTEVTAIVEQDVKSELISTAESLNTRYDGVSLNVMELGNAIQMLTKKVDIVEQDIQRELMDIAESMNIRYEETHQMMIAQKELVIKIAKLLGFPAEYTS